MNLTQCLLPDHFKEASKFDRFKDDVLDSQNPKMSVARILEPILKTETLSDFKADLANYIKAIPSDTMPNTYLIAGGMDLTMYESKFSLGFENGEHYRFIPGTLTQIFKKFAIDQQFDLVLMDLSPSIGDFNRAIILGSDYFFSPVFPDVFSREAMQNIVRHVPLWSHQKKKGTPSRQKNDKIT